MEISERLIDAQRAHSLHRLAWLLYVDGQLDAAEETASRSIDLADNFDQSLVCQCHRLLGNIYSSKDETEKAVDHLEAALSVAASFGGYLHQFWIHHSLARLFSYQGRFDASQAHIEHTKSYAINNTYLMGRVMYLQAVVWYHYGKLGEARSEALCAANVFEKLGATGDLEMCGDLLRDTEEQVGALASEGELPGTVLIPARVNFPP